MPTKKRSSSSPTAAAAAAEVAQPGNLYAPDCPGRLVLEHLTSRWGVLALVALLQHAYRFSDLRRKIGGVSEKMLAQTLRVLEADGFVRREVFPEIPPRVQYSLTPMGREAARHVAVLAYWIENNLGRVLSARDEKTRRSA